MSEPDIIVQHREELAELLTEAVEVEHNLMCCYLFAAWSLRSASDGLPPETSAEVERWRSSIVSIAIDEMAHFANANNLLSSIGSRPHLGRPNFPISPGYHPADVVVHLRRFEQGTIDHFVFLERPEGVDLADGEGFVHAHAYHRGTHERMLMPTAQDYATVGHLYRSIRAGLVRLAEELGEEVLFVGDPAQQVRPDQMQLDGLVAVHDLASALQAVDEVVRQGEGNADDPENSHYRRFCDIRDAFAALREADPGFDPARPVASNPVQRKPPLQGDRVWVGAPEAAGVLDLCNAVYNHMLRLLGAVYDRVPDATRGALLGEGIGLMRVLGPLNEVLTRLPAHDDAAVTAGMSFAVTREIRVPPSGRSLSILVDRTRELATGALRLGDIDPCLGDVGARLNAMAARLERLEWTVASEEVSAAEAPAAAPRVAPPREVIDGVEIIQGEHLELRFDTNRCIHARHCVLGAPQVFLANVEGAWIYPDAMDTDDLIAVAQRCPSGAITYQRKDGRADEAPPAVNRLNVRENGPLAVRADLRITGQAPRHRAVLCRCGKSKSKPFCDNSHKEAGFTATGEPTPTETIVALEVRDGVLQVNPAPDGPLLVSGNLELCTGTGATFAKKTKCALCRCGGSANKPFCDGTHRTNGFRSE